VNRNSFFYHTSYYMHQSYIANYKIQLNKNVIHTHIHTFDFFEVYGWWAKLYDLCVNSLEIIFLSQQRIFCIEASFVSPTSGCASTKSDYAKRFPFILVSNVLSLPGRHSTLSVIRHIESTDRKRGSEICLEFPLLFSHCRSLTTTCLSLKLTI